MASLKTGELDYRTADKVVFFKWIHSNPDFIVSKNLMELAFVKF